jgi:hypothetical protein
MPPPPVGGQHRGREDNADRTAGWKGEGPNFDRSATHGITRPGDIVTPRDEVVAIRPTAIVHPRPDRAWLG